MAAVVVPTAVTPVSTRDKYRIVPRVKTPIREDEIRITSDGRVPRYVNYAARLFAEQKKRTVMIKATGNAISSAIILAEIVKRRFENLYQLNTIGMTTISDTYEPLEEGLDEVTRERDVPYIEIMLTLDHETLDKKHYGYQEPVDQTLVKLMDVEQITAYRGRRGGRQSFSRGGPRGRGRGGSVSGGAGGDTRFVGYRGGSYRGGRGMPRGRGGPRGGFRGGRRGYGATGGFRQRNE